MTDAAQKIAERVPLPEPAMRSAENGGGGLIWDVDARAYGLAVAAEALRGAEAVAVVSEMSFDGVALIDWHVDPVVGTKLYTTPPAGSVEVTDSVIERVAIAIASRDVASWFDGPAEKAWLHTRESTRDEYRAMARKAIGALTAALQEPDNG